MIAKVLLLPFCCDGYDDGVVDRQITQMKDRLQKSGLQVEAAKPIKTYGQAARVAEAYNPYSYDFPVLFPVTWSEPRLAAVAARQFFGKPMITTCVGEFAQDGERIEMSSTPAAAALQGSLQEMGVQSEFFPDLLYGRWEKELRFFASAAHCIRKLQNAKIGFFGHNFNGITAADFDLSLLRRKFGIEIYSFDVSELLHRMGSYHDTEPAYAEMQKKVAARLSGHVGSYQDKLIRMCLALAQYVEEYDLQVIDLRCHTELSQTFGMTACLPLSVLGDTVVCSCEADLPVAVTQLILQNLSGGKVTTYVDLRTFTEQHMDVGACGFAPCSLTGGTAKVDSDRGAGAGYLTNSSSFEKGTVSLARMIKSPGGKTALHFTAAVLETPSSRLREMNCPGYPMGRIIPHCSMEDFLSHVGANHYALVYEDCSEAAGYFCKYMNMELL